MSRKSTRLLKPVKRYGQDEDEERNPARTPISKAEWLETAKRLRAKKQTKDTVVTPEPLSDNEADGDKVEPGDSASQVSYKSAVASESESTVQRRLELQMRQAKLLQELKEQEDQQQIELQELKLAQLKLQKAKRTELYSIETEQHALNGKVSCNRFDISKSSKARVVLNRPEDIDRAIDLDHSLTPDEAKRRAFREKISQAAPQPRATVTVSDNQLLNPHATPYVSRSGVSNSVFGNLRWSGLTSPQISNAPYPNHVTMVPGGGYSLSSAYSATLSLQPNHPTLSANHLPATNSNIYRPAALVVSNGFEPVAVSSPWVGPAFNQPLGLHTVHTSQASSLGNTGPTSNPVTRLTEGDDLLKAMVFQQHELIDSIRLPQTAAVTFDGDCLRYYAFVKSFDNLIAKSHLDDATRLNRLYQCCTKDAKRVVETCLLIDNPVTGYQRARSLLADRYGNPYKISQAWISKIMEFKPVKAGENSRI